MQMLDAQRNGTPETGLVERARRLAPLIAAAAPRIEAERELPADLLAALHDARMYRALLPRSVGGDEAAPPEFVRAIEIIAAEDASAAWCVGQGSGCSMSAAYLGAEAMQEVFGPRDAVLAWGPPSAPPRAEAVEGGYRVTGTWQFASGSRHATWLGAQVTAYEPDGSVRKGPNGKPLPMQALFPRSSATITDVWQVVGLRGTGSDTYAVRDLFVPERHVYVREVASVREPGPLYRFSVVNIYALAFPGIAMGIARAMLDAFEALAAVKKPTRSGSGMLLRENPSIQSQVAICEARLRAARALHFATMEQAWAEVCAGEPLTLDRRIEMRMCSTHAIQTAKDVADFAYTAAGTNAIFEAGPFERRFRDIHAVTQQVQGHAANFETVGAHLLGLPVELNL